ncbi:hypothetical protein HDU96_004510 [Phlyctochytrium bullatum]|nr:hypothetical protein HDU96_004510 [Phlyctochytrium bullatum]
MQRPQQLAETIRVPGGGHLAEQLQAKVQDGLRLQDIRELHVARIQEADLTSDILRNLPKLKRLVIDNFLYPSDSAADLAAFLGRFERSPLEAIVVRDLTGHGLGEDVDVDEESRDRCFDVVLGNVRELKLKGITERKWSIEDNKFVFHRLATEGYCVVAI